MLIKYYYICARTFFISVWKSVLSNGVCYFYTDTSHTCSKHQKSAKNETPKIREIDASYFCLSTLWQSLNMKGIQWPETETIWIYLNLFVKTREITSVNLLHQVGRRWNAEEWNRIRHHFSVWQFVLEIGYWGQNRIIY